jgi:hypothetical protein
MEKEEVRKKGRDGNEGFWKGLFKYVVWPYVVVSGVLATGHLMNYKAGREVANNTNDTTLRALAEGYADSELRRAYTSSFTLWFDQFENRPFGRPKGVVMKDRNDEYIARGKNLMRGQTAQTQQSRGGSSSSAD